MYRPRAPIARVESPQRPAAAGSPAAATTLELTLCPDCGAPAEVVHRFVAQSSDGPVEEVKVRCLDRHWFLLPVSYLERN